MLLSMRFVRPFGLASVVTLSGVALAGPAPTLIPVNQIRDVQTDILFVPQCNSSASAGDAAVAFEPFSTQVPLVVSCADANITTTASQLSQIGLSSLSASGQSKYDTTAQIPGTVIIMGRSTFSVTFQVPVASRFAINSTLVAHVQSIGGASFATATINLLHELPNEVVILAGTTDGLPAGQPAFFSAVGVLAPGLYTLNARSDTFLDDSAAPSANGAASYSVAFSLLAPCPADFDGDGVVGSSDLAALLGRWGFCGLNPALCPDLNGDGFVGAFDLATMLGQWGACP